MQAPLPPGECKPVDARTDKPTPVYNWLVALVVVLFVAGGVNCTQTFHREETELRAEQRKDVLGSNEDYLAKLFFAVNYNTPWLAYGFAAWLALCLERQIAELQKVRASIENANRNCLTSDSK